MRKIRSVVTAAVILVVVPAACANYSAPPTDGGQGGTAGSTGTTATTGMGGTGTTPAMCGNSVVEAGESCDPPGSCPTTCADDGNSCTVDQLTGSADTCNVTCEHTAITTCVAGDGCCPSSCDATTDSDCSATCGNGMVDANETCDPPDSCPTSCDDTDPCTTDQLTGSAQNCNALCSNTPITTCTGGDGCCPAGCTGAADSDCGGGGATCGNNVVDAGETCDPPSSCPTTCADDSNPCTTDEITGSADACTAQCSHTAITMCAAGDGCCPDGCDNSTDSDCSATCGNGMVDANETCDPPASCPTTCDDDGDPCTTDEITGSAQNCNAECTHTAITSCTGGDGCCPDSCTSGNDSDCGGGGGTLPCDVLTAGGQQCVSAHSTVRVIVTGYAGPLYQLCKGNASAGPSSCKGQTQDIGSSGGFADAAAHDAFCQGGQCTITKIYDQSGQGNDLEPAPSGGAKPSPDNPADASALPVTINGHSAYGILIKAGIGYRTGCGGCNIKTGNGTATGDEPQTMYWVTSQRDLIDGCCFDYGNAETTSNDDGNGTMETLYFGGGVVWGTGAGGKPGPWMMADLENGLYAGWENNQDQNISTNTALKYDFVTGVVVGDTREKNNNGGRFAIYGGDATNGTLKTMYDGIRPQKNGYVPMRKQGSIILGIGGDNSNSAGGRFYEGIVANGAATKDTIDALQAAIVAAGYGK